MMGFEGVDGLSGQPSMAATETRGITEYRKADRPQRNAGLVRVVGTFLDLLEQDVDFDSEHGAEQDEEQEERDDDR